MQKSTYNEATYFELNGVVVIAREYLPGKWRLSSPTNKYLNETGTKKQVEKAAARYLKRNA